MGTEPDLNQQLFARGAMSGGAGGNGAVLGLLPNVDFSRGYSLQSATPLAFVNANMQTPIASLLSNAPGNKPGQQNFLQKFAASCREDFEKIKQAGDQLLSAGAQSCAIQPGERIAAGATPPAASGGMELG